MLRRVKRWWVIRTMAKRCRVCERRLPLVSVNVEIPNMAPEPNSGPMVIDDLMCAECARMFGVEA